MDIQAFIPERTIERFDEGIICWFAWPKQRELDRMMMRPHVDETTEELATVTAGLA